MSCRHNYMPHQCPACAQEAGLVSAQGIVQVGPGAALDKKTEKRRSFYLDALAASNSLPEIDRAAFMLGFMACAERLP